MKPFLKRLNANAKDNDEDKSGDKNKSVSKNLSIKEKQHLIEHLWKVVVKQMASLPSGPDERAVAPDPGYLGDDALLPTGGLLHRLQERECT